MDNKIFLYNILMNNDFSEENILKLCNIIPEIIPTINFDHNHPHHHLDVFKHTLYAISISVYNFDVRLSLLLHDIGKPDCHFINKRGTSSYHNHPIKSAEYTYNILSRLGYEKDYISKIVFLVKEHDTKLPLDYYLLEDFKNDISLEVLELLLEVQTSDAYAHHPDHLEKRINYINELKNIIKDLGKNKII